MKIVEPSYEILQCPDGGECLTFLERCARTCYKSEDKITEGTWKPCPECGGTKQVVPKVRSFSEWRPLGAPVRCTHCNSDGMVRDQESSSHKLIRQVLKRGHESVIEHMVITVKFIVDRGVSHELVRHRLCAFSQESTRYCNYGGDGKELTFIRPYFWKVGWHEYLEWRRAMEYAESYYLGLLERGAKPEEARSVLPNSLKTEIVTTANLREWRHILKLRTSPKAHPQMRQVMQPLLEELRKRIPIIFGEF